MLLGIACLIFAKQTLKTIIAMRKPPLTLLAALLAAVALCSCAREEPVPAGTAEVRPKSASLSPTAETYDVTYEDISGVATLFASGRGKTPTRGGDGFSLSVIFDGAGNPAIHVVNFARGGFMLISATKRMPPVLAFSDKGSFDATGRMPDALKAWRDEAVEAVGMSASLPADTVEHYRALWRRYERSQAAGNVASPASSSGSELDDMKMRAQMILQDSVMMWRNRGWRVVEPYGADLGLTEEQTAEMIEGAIYPLYQDEWERLSMAVEKVYENVDEIPDFMGSTWGQDNGYNSAFPTIAGLYPLAGCGPVAAGQIMRYHEHPRPFRLGGDAAQRAKRNDLPLPLRSGGGRQGRHVTDCDRNIFFKYKRSV